MKALRIGFRALAVGSALITVGCGTTRPAKFYTLAPIVAPSAQSPLSASVLVGPVTIPAAVDRPEFVLQTASNRVDVDEFDRWAAPLGDAIATTLAADLSSSLGSSNVATAPLGNFKADYVVTVNVLRFDAAAGKETNFEAVWTVNRIADGATRTGRTSDRESVQDAALDSVAAAHSRAIARMSDDIASSIRATSLQK